MSRRPEQLERLDTILGAATYAHETIFELRRLSLGRGLEVGEVSELLAESARIAALELPRILDGLRDLSSRWHDEALLDPDTAAKTAEEIGARLDALEPRVMPLLRRQGEIVARLRAMLAS
jgi:hypothetical protein